MLLFGIDFHRTASEAGPLPSLVCWSWPSDHWPLAIDLEVSAMRSSKKSLVSGS